MKKTFVLSDQTVNMYGYVVLTAGIGLARFLENPVMLFNHDKDCVIGRWENIRIENNQLLADAEFDLNDEEAAKIAKKVDDGFIKAASVWIDFEEKDVKLDAPGYIGIPTVVNCVLMEASVVSVPANRSALTLSAGGKKIEDDQLARKLSAEFKKHKHMNEELKPIFEALGLTLSATSTADHAVEAIKALKKTSGDATEKVTTLEAQLSAINENKAVELVESAIASKKLSADSKDHFMKLAKADFDSTKAIIEKMTPYKSIADQLNAGGKGDQGNQDPYAGKTYKDLQKENPQYLAAMRKNEPERYKQLWLAAFPNGKFNG